MISFSLISALWAFIAVCSTSTGPWEAGNWDWVPQHQESVREHGHDQYHLAGFKGQHGDGYTKTISSGHRADWGDYNYGGHGDYLKASSYGSDEGKAREIDRARRFEGTKDKAWNHLYTHNHDNSNRDDNGDNDEYDHDRDLYDFHNHHYYQHPQYIHHSDH